MSPTREPTTGGRPTGAAVVFFASVLMGAWLVFANHQGASWWPDEQVYVKTAERLAHSRTLVLESPAGEVLPLVNFYRPRLDGTYVSKYPPGFPLLLSIWYRWFGPWGCFWFNAALGLLCLGLLVWCGRLLLGLEAGLLAASLLAVNPIFLRYANSAMSDIVGVGLSLAALVTVLRARRRPVGWGRALMIGAAGVMCAYAGFVRYPAALGGVVVGAALLPGLRLPEASDIRASLRDIGALMLGGMLVIAIMWSVLSRPPVPPEAQESVVEVEDAPISQVLETEVRMILWVNFSSRFVARNVEALGEVLPSLEAGGLAYPALLGLFLLAYRRASVALLILAWTAPLLTLYLFYQTPLEQVGQLRHLLIAFPALALAGAAVPLALASRLLPGRPRWGSGLAAAVTAAWVGVGAYQAQQQLVEWARAFEDPGPILQAVEESVPVGATILGGRQKLRVLSLGFGDRYELRVLNQIERPPEIVPERTHQLGTGWHSGFKGKHHWKSHLVEWPWVWPELARNNEPRINGWLRSRRRVYVVLRTHQAGRFLRAFKPRFRVRPVYLQNDDYVVCELKPRRPPRPRAIKDGASRRRPSSPRSRGRGPSR